MLKRGGCVHGEELNYVFGYPLLRPEDKTGPNGNNGGKSGGGGRSRLSGNEGGGTTFSRNEANLALNIIQFWSNFAATG